MGMSTGLLLDLSIGKPKNIVLGNLFCGCIGGLKMVSFGDRANDGSSGSRY